MLSLLSNNALMKRFLIYVALAPLVLRWVERAEENHDLEDGPAKRAQVLEACKAMFETAVGRGFIPVEATVNLEKTAGELVDMTVDVYNRVGLFPPKTPEGKAAAKAGKAHK